MTAVPGLHKRTRSVSPASSVASSKRSLAGSRHGTGPRSCFAKGLFAKAGQYRIQHAESGPYKHCVINNLVNDKLLRRVRREIMTSLHFTPKETDIYKLHQTGDLANLSGLKSSNDRAKLAGLTRLRDGLYSPDFRAFVEKIADCGPLSGQKQDMSINCYVKGSHLLTHDDVIGSRRVSYILYLPDPDDADASGHSKDDDAHAGGTGWDPKWGGGLRLYDIAEKNVPYADFEKVIPPAWNQLAFFVVQPAVSFHDVEEVYVDNKPRLAISGWFHLPQPGEQGYVKGLQEKLNLESSRAQLAGQAAAEAAGLGEAPASVLNPVEQEPDVNGNGDVDDDTELKNFLHESLLDADVVSKLRDRFVEDSLLEIGDLLNLEFAKRLKDYVETQDKVDAATVAQVSDKLPGWSVSQPPHKHRYLYLNHGHDHDDEQHDPVTELRNFIASGPFRRWLAAVSGLDAPPTHQRVLARRFRPGQDYTLATASLNEEAEGNLEITLNLTPTSGWDDGELGGYELLMDGNAEEDHNGKDREGEDGHDPAVYLSSSHAKRKKELAALRAELSSKPAQQDDNDHGDSSASSSDDDDDDDEQGSGVEDEDSSVLHTSQASWNLLTIVFRDKGVLKFVKYVSQNAPGSRWDITAEYK
ncbi:Oxoglutarate and iron-dependent oxygenase degradation C-term-domain-containing protein [Lipomyces japonicus]|uniref:Oxoglutarate and iron-dependent oxygenase degradation C-term-domain-containing protein n=1 Tax=Lipomyces japonicus TaxID=56871 RepID=UPI0034CF3E7F